MLQGLAHDGQDTVVLDPTTHAQAGAQLRWNAPAQQWEADQIPRATGGRGLPRCKTPKSPPFTNFEHSRARSRRLPACLGKRRIGAVPSGRRSRSSLGARRIGARDRRARDRIRRRLQSGREDSFVSRAIVRSR